MTAYRYLAVKDFRRFQHYRDRDPVWIKLYTNLLIDAAFLQLPEAAQAQLMKLWILASQLGNPLPNNPKLLAGKIGAIGKFHLAAIITAGFLVPTDDPNAEDGSASNSLAQPEEFASNSLADALANSEQNLAASVRGRARSRESESERDKETITRQTAVEPVVRLCAAANRGLAEHPSRPQSIPRVIPTTGSSLEALKEIVLSGVPMEFAESAIYQLARTHRADRQVSSLKYFVQGVARLWEEHSAGAAASTASPASLPERRTGVDPSELVTTIRGLVQNNGHRSFIPIAAVDALGPVVGNAYRAVGGADRFLNVGSDKLPFLIKDFAQALSNARRAPLAMATG